jgi:hypothetical protein
MACYYSKNPINVQVVTTGAFNTTEIQIFANSESGSPTFTSLGVFRFISDSASEVNQDIASVLDAHCIRVLKQSIPNNDGLFEELLKHTLTWYISHRHYDSGTWSSWTDEDQHQVIFGGRGYEEVESGNLELTSQMLRTNDNDFAAYVIDGAFYALIETADTYNYTVEHSEYSGGFNGSETDSFTTTGLFSVVKIPIGNPAGTYKSIITIDLGASELTGTIIHDTYPHEQQEDFVFLSLRNGWRSLGCTGNLSAIIEVAQNTYETQQQHEYYNNANISTSEVWRSLGSKKYKVATGFLPESMIEQLLQDFLLSPKKFKWDANLEKFIPVIVNTKSVEYLNTGRKGLKSFSFEYRLAFDNNQPSAI